MKLATLILMATLSPIDVTRAYQQFAGASSRSLSDYLGYVVVDSEPEPRAWSRIVEPWQVDIVRPIIPAVESMAGLRDDYTGPRSFWFTLPRGHDKTGLIGRLANWSVGFSRNKITCAVAASTRKQAGLLLKSMTRETELNPWLAGRLESFREDIRGPGGEINVLSSEAGASSGRKDDLVILDELTFWENQGLWDVLRTGAVKRDRSVFIVITNAGLRNTWQHDIRNRAERSDRWYFYESPPGRMLASWLTPESVAEIRQEISPGFARRVFDNEWIDATETPMLTRAMIDACTESGILWRHAEPPKDVKRPELYMGVDFGFTQDRTAIVTLQRTKDRIITREILVMEKAHPDDQMAAVEHRLSDNVVRCRVDQGAQGWVLAKRLEERFPGKVEPVGLTPGRQGQYATELRASFVSRRIAIPDDEQLAADLQLVEEAETVNGVPRIVTNKGITGHADRFWALAMAHSCIPLKPRQRASRPLARKSRYA